MSDPGKYRTAEEVKRFRERDPVRLFKESLKEAKALTDENFEDIEAEARETVQKAVEYAENSPPPEKGELFTDVFA